MFAITHNLEAISQKKKNPGEKASTLSTGRWRRKNVIIITANQNLLACMSKTIYRSYVYIMYVCNYIYSYKYTILICMMFLLNKNYLFTIQACWTPHYCLPIKILFGPFLLQQEEKENTQLSRDTRTCAGQVQQNNCFKFKYSGHHTFSDTKLP